MMGRQGRCGVVPAWRMRSRQDCCDVVAYLKLLILENENILIHTCQESVPTILSRI
jgi:hypothetical protein